MFPILQTSERWSLIQKKHKIVHGSTNFNFSVSQLNTSDSLEEELGLKMELGWTEIGTELGVQKKILKLQIT